MGETCKFLPAPGGIENLASKIDGGEIDQRENLIAMEKGVSRKLTLVNHSLITSY